MAKAPSEKRIIMIKIFVEGQEVRFKQVSYVPEMLDLDQQVLAETQAFQGQSKANTDKRKKGAKIEKGQRVHADDYKGELEYAHPGIHLFASTKDEIMFYSEDPINFVVDIERDPELMLLEQDASSADPVVGQKNTGIDNPFQRADGRLESFAGEPVLTGALKDTKNNPDIKRFRDQRFYKYTVTVTGITKPLDPHIDGHFDN